VGSIETNHFFVMDYGYSRRIGRFVFTHESATRMQLGKNGDEIETGLY